MNIDQPMYTTNELADLLGMRPQSITNWRSRGKGPNFVYLGDGPRPAVRYTREAIEEFLKERK
ncbi:helix-turn-helix domain-containing protein [Corynebacterium sp. SCR221107]|uniref:helix-turn-helix domain-containing protein n=1 Tax=Corynebacterium sp. SCR221107 TaxID=3017361 RepID=UPI0022EC97F8|nr:helix-turn-helix domain-containing protein [Corynebacterium sp. SCR221107]WBT08118.1 helix-turn-helix domain-containing protein [Corynebacterium sp. SCR221107]